MDAFPRSARWLLWITYGGYPILLVLFIATAWDATGQYGWRFSNPVIWGFANFFAGCWHAAQGSGERVLGDLLAFYRSDPWGNWVLVDHLGLKILLSFLLCWDAWSSGRRVWPYVLALYVVGSLAPLFYFLPRLQAVRRAAMPHRARPAAAVVEGAR
jgi:hypothetical protein